MFIADFLREQNQRHNKIILLLTAEHIVILISVIFIVVAVIRRRSFDKTHKWGERVPRNIKIP